MSGPQRGLVFAAVAALVIGLAMSGCSSGSGHDPEEPKDQDHMTANTVQEETVLKAVKQYYAEKGLSEPERIVIIHRDETSWTVHAGPEIKESEFLINPRTGQIIKFTPGE